MHPAWTYMLADVGGAFWGVLLFSVALVTPGYLFGHAVDICRFRNAGLREKLAWSVALSFGVSTVLVVGAVWLGGVATGVFVLGAVGVAGPLWAYATATFKTLKFCSAVPFLLLALFVCVFVVGSLVDVGFGNHLFMSVTAYDNALRTAFVDAVLRTGVPPASPVYWPGHAAPMRYYYFWYVLCAVIAKLGHISARQALIASSTWSIFGVFALIALVQRHVLEWRGEVLRKRWWVATGLLAVTGLDGLIALVYFLATRTVARDIEWWSLDQVSSWADTFLWVPHHAAALVCCLSTLVLLNVSIKEGVEGRANATAVIAGISFASAFGLSTYVAIGMALVLGFWAVQLSFTTVSRRALRRFLIAVIAATVVMAPYLYQLLAPQPGARQSAGRVLALGIRELLPPAVLLDLPGLHELQVVHPYAAKEISASLLLIPSYFLELGFFAIALLVFQRQRDKTSSERLLLFLTCVSLLCVSVVRSRVIAMNDFAVRASLIPQFLLLLVGAIALEKSRQLTRTVLLALLVVGAVTSAYQVVLLRTYLPIHENEGIGEYADLGQRNYELRGAYMEMQQKIPTYARIQFNVPNNSYTGFAELANAGRQLIVEDSRCNDSFGGEIGPCPAIQDEVSKLFSSKGAPNAADAISLCDSLGVDYLAAARWNDVWDQPSSWVWTLPTVVAHKAVRVVDCSTHPHATLDNK